MQWHPIFASLLRALVHEYYEVRTDVPVGEKPRQADIVLLQRTAPAPFVGIWRHLTIWNVLEFKGPTDTPALRDLDLLVELGLGIDRRLQEESETGQSLLNRDEVSWWYLANHVGGRFRNEAEDLFGPVQPAGAGLWRCRAVGHVLWLVSRDELPVDGESLLLHLVTEESAEQTLAVAREVVRRPAHWNTYGAWLAYLYPNIWEEVQSMVRQLGTEPSLDLRPLIHQVGLGQVIDQVGLKEVIDQIGLKQVIDEVGLKQVIDEVGLKQVIDEVGLKQVIDEVGLKQVIDEVGLDQLIATAGSAQTIEVLLARLTPEQLVELKRKLQ